MRELTKEEVAAWEALCAACANTDEKIAFHRFMAKIISPLPQQHESKESP